MNLDALEALIKERNALLLVSNGCLGCKEIKPIIGLKFIDYTIGEHTCIAVWLCGKCISSSDVKLEG